MQRVKRFVSRLLALHPRWLCLLVPVSVVALIAAFKSGWQQSILSYAAYIVSAYTLFVLGVKAPRWVQSIKKWVYANRYSRRYLSEIPYRTKITLYLSLFTNLLFAVFKFISGLLYSSLWFGAVAVYYVILCVVRFLLLRHVGRENMEHPHSYRKCRSCGVFLLVLNIPLASMVVQMVYSGARYHYPGFIIYAVAAYAFASLTVAIVGLLRYRKLNSPIYAAAKAISLVSALVAMLTLQTAMFSSFGTDAGLEHLMNAITGAAVCMAITGIAFYMIIKSNRALQTRRHKVAIPIKE